MLVIAHRGASAAAQENTPAAFELADRMGADGVEFDVRRWPPHDRVSRLVVEHDPLPDDLDAVERMPDLADVLDACGERMLVNVEIKNGDASGPRDPTMAVAEATVEALRARGDRHRERWLVSSFSPSTVAHVRRVAPELRTALLVEDLDDDAIAMAVRDGHVAVHPDVTSLSADAVVRAHDAGLLVTGWTCNDPSRIVELAEMGVDAVCTDVPDVALSSLGRSGANPPGELRWPSTPRADRRR